MKMTADESAAVALALAALRSQSVPAAGGSRRRSRWSSKALHDLEAGGSDSRADHDGLSTWVAAARLEALRDDV
jgi:hypothetical protein